MTSERSGLSGAGNTSLHWKPLLALFAIFFAVFTLVPGPFLFGLQTKAQDMTVPPDFELSITVSPMRPRSDMDIDWVRINADGTAILSTQKWQPEQATDVEVQLPEGAVSAIYQTVMNEGFFELQTSYVDPNILDGDYAVMTVTANGETHQVTTTNIEVAAFDRIAMKVNSYLPETRTIMYNAIFGVSDYGEVEK